MQEDNATGWGAMGDCGGDVAAASFRGVVAVAVAVALQGWIVGDEAAAEHWFGGGKWLG